MNEINKKNNVKSFKYKLNITPSYIQVKCESCNLFAYWYSVNGSDTIKLEAYIKDKDENKSLKNIDEFVLNLKMFRKI